MSRFNTILISFVLTVLLTVSFTLESNTVLDSVILANTPSGYFYDLYLKNVLVQKQNLLEIKNKLTVGYSENDPYFVNSTYVELGTSEVSVGFKKTIKEGNQFGGFLKYAYPPLKELNSVFLFDDLAYRDRIIEYQNKLNIQEFTPIDTLYTNMKFGKLTLRSRTYYVPRESTYSKKLSYFSDNTYEVSYDMDGWEHGVYFIPGRMNDYYYLNVYADLNGSVQLADDKYKDIFVYGLAKDRFKVNLGIYDRQHLQFISGRLVIPEGENEYVYYLNSDFINRSSSFYYTKNYVEELYINYHYEIANDPNYFISFADTYDLKEFKLRYLIGMRKVNQYRGYIYNIGINYNVDENSQVNISIGNTLFQSVWDMWSILPENNKLILRIGWKYSL